MNMCIHPDQNDVAPRPWKKQHGIIHTEIFDATGEYIFKIPFGENIVDYILCCVNTHDRLVAALEHSKDYIFDIQNSDWSVEFIGIEDMLRELESVLAEAKGEK